MQNFGRDIGDILGSKRFGQQSMAQGQNIANLLAQGFIRKSEEDRRKEELARADQTNLNRTIGTLGGALIGSAFDEGAMGASIGAAIGGGESADVTNMISVMAKRGTEKLASQQATAKLTQDKTIADEKLAQEIIDKDRELKIKEDQLQLNEIKASNDLIIRTEALNQGNKEAADELGFKYDKLNQENINNLEQLDIERKKLTGLKVKQADAKSSFDLVKNNLEIVPDGTVGAQEINIVDASSPDGYKKVQVKTRGLGKKYTESQVKQVEEVEKIFSNNKDLSTYRGAHKDINDLRAALLKNDPTLVGALKSRIARALAGEKGVLTDRDVIRAGGSEARAAKIARFFNKEFKGKMNKQDVEAFVSYIDELKTGLETVNNKFITDTFDTRSQISDMSEKQFKEVFKDRFLLSSKVTAVGYSKRNGKVRLSDGREVSEEEADKILGGQ